MCRIFLVSLCLTVITGCTLPNTNVPGVDYLAVKTKQGIIIPDSTVQEQALGYKPFEVIAKASCPLSHQTGDNIGTYSWIFIRGSLMSKEELEASKLKEDVKNFLLNDAEVIEQYDENNIEHRSKNAKIKDKDGSYKYQLVTVRFKFETKEGQDPDRFMIHQTKVEYYFGKPSVSGANNGVDATFILDFTRRDTSQINPIGTWRATVYGLDPTNTRVDDTPRLIPCYDDEIRGKDVGPFPNDTGLYSIHVSIIEKASIR